MARIRFVREFTQSSLLSGDKLFVIGPEKALAGSSKALTSLPDRIADAVRAIAKAASPELQPTVRSAWLDAGLPELVVGVLPQTVSRHNTPSRARATWQALADGKARRGSKVGIVFVIERAEHVQPIVNALSRVFPTYDRHSGHKAASVAVLILNAADGKPIVADTLTKETLESSRLAAELVDTPPNEMDPDRLAGRARLALKGLDRVTIKEIKGNALVQQGLLAIHSVGRAAVAPPRLLIADYRPARAPKGAPHIALVGKGITYDTGGLHLKPRGGMEGMKSDMGGAAATLGAFRTLAKTKCPRRVTLLLCIAENAVGPTAFKPDDVFAMHSGMTVEINNTDAEGRLVLADGVSYAVRKLGADVVLDAATLTGAQLVATGHMHAAVMSNDADLETLMVDAGRASGDLLFPLPFAPEFYRKEFDSPVADLRNSVKDRRNAQSSCAAEFIHAQIADQGARWAHVDLAGPAFYQDRGTGFGVAALAEAVRRL